MTDTPAARLEKSLWWYRHLMGAQAMADGERIGIRIVPPVAQPPCAHCWHPHVGAWAGSLPVPRHCCWCGVHEGPQHGPYAEGQ
jgi:hypothetical protein